MAYLDLLNGVAACDRIESAQAKAAAEPAGQCAADNDAETGPADDGPDDEGPDDRGPGNGDPPGSGPDGSGCEDAPLPRPAELVIPLPTLLGLASVPGESHTLGPIDAALCRDLAATAANSLRSEWCVTIVDEHGFAIEHGCARLAAGDKATWKSWPGQPESNDGNLAALPSRVNLTIAASALSGLAARGDPCNRDDQALGQPSAWSFTPRDKTVDGIGPPGSRSTPGSSTTAGTTWTLTLPGGRMLTVTLEPVATYACDHARESHAYQPNDTLRHLVQVRDGTCTFPSCSRHARDTDFEHALPYDRGGRTCACNAGARSWKCHRVKQSPGWNVTQPKPGWHQWTAPSGRTYTQEPKRYPA
jgi:hypothetical protein